MTHGTITNSYLFASTFSPADSSYTYNFASSLPSYAIGVNTGLSTSSSSNVPYTISSSDFVNLTSTAESYVASALTNMAGVGNVTFDYLSSSSADIVISGLNVQLYDPASHDPIGGFAYGFGSHQIASDLFVPTSSLALDRVISHELGHSIGLLDANATALSGGVQDNFRYSMMSYALHPGENRVSAELQLYDIASIQAMYGRASHNDGSTTYSSFVDGSSNARMFSIWDSGGSDTIDTSGQASPALIDLRPGYFSSIGPATAVDITITDGVPSVVNAGHLNISIAYGAYIENAVGTDYNDLIIGNVLSNVLTGGDGNDVIYAEGANSVYDAGDGDYQQISSTSSTHLEAAASGVANFVTDHSQQEDVLYGGDGDDLLFGGDGNDILVGGAGSDWISGGSGTNAIFGGELNSDAQSDPSELDVVDYSSLSSPLTIAVNGQGTSFWIGAASDQLHSIESVIGTDGADTLAINGTLPDTFILNVDGKGTTSGHQTVDLSGSTDTGGLIVVISPFVSAIGKLSAPFGGITLQGFDDAYVEGSSNTDLVMNLASGYHEIHGNGGDDSLAVTDGTNSGGPALLSGGDGNDILTGGDGNDTLIGGTGWDSLSGGSGADFLRGEYDDTGFMAGLSGGAGHDAIVIGGSTIGGLVSTAGGTGNDYIKVGTGTGLAYNFSVGDGHDVIEVAGGDNYAISLTMNGFDMDDVTFEFHLSDESFVDYDNDNTESHYQGVGDLLIYGSGGSDSIVIKDIAIDFNVDDEFDDFENISFADLKAYSVALATTFDDGTPFGAEGRWYVDHWDSNDIAFNITGEAVGSGYTSALSDFETARVNDVSISSSLWLV